MRQFILFLFIIVISGAIGVFLVYEPGSLIITVSGYIFETPLWFAIVSIIVLMLFISFIIKVSKGTIQLPFMFSSFVIKRKRNKSLAFLKENILYGLSDDYDSILQRLNNDKRAKHYQWLNFINLSEIGFLTEAHALLKTKQFDKLQTLIDELDAKKVNPEYLIWLKVQVSLAKGDIESIRNIHHLLSDAKLTYPKSRLIYRALIDYNLHQGRPVEILPLLEEAQDYQLFSQGEIDQFYQVAITSGLKLLNHANEVTLSEFWDVIPPKYKKENSVYLAYIQALIAVGDGKKAENTLKKLLKKSEDINYIKLWAKLQHISTGERLTFLKNHLSDSALAGKSEVSIIFAKLAMESGNFEEAKRLLERVAETPEVTGLLADIYHHLNMQNKSIDYYQRTLSCYL